MTWKDILKNEPPLPPMPPASEPKTKYPQRTDDDFRNIVTQTLIPAMKSKGKSPYRFTRDEDPEIFYLLQNAQKEGESDIIRAFNNLGHGIPKITFEPNTVIIALRGKM